MNKITTFVRADRLRLAALFQSSEPERYYLNGVFIHTVGDGVCIAGTNGNILAVLRDEAGFTETGCIVRLPKGALAEIKATKEREYLWFGIVGEHFGTGRRAARIFDTNKGFCDPTEAQDAMLEETHPGVVWSGAVDLIDGTFPEYSATIPSRRAKLAETMTFNPKVAAPFFEVALDKGMTGVRFYSAGEKAPVLVDCGRADFTGVLMPSRVDPSMTDAGNFVRPPEWAMARMNDLLGPLSVAET